MSHFKHPATIVATIALFVALSGAAGAAISGMISGSQIKPHSIAQNKLSASAVKGLSALQGISGAQSTSIGHQGLVGHNSGKIVILCPKNTTATPTWCSAPTTVKFGKKTAVLVTAALDLASNNGSNVQANIGICYASHGSLNLVSVQYVEPSFTAPADSYFANATNGVVKGLSPGTYDVGFCLDSETANALNGWFNVSTVTLETK